MMKRESHGPGARNGGLARGNEKGDVRYVLHSKQP
jgi:hypothetical protein